MNTITLIIVLLVKKTIHADFYDLNRDTESSHEGSKFKVCYRVDITQYKKKFTKGYTENWLKEIIVINVVLKTNNWAYKLKI